MGLIFQRKRPTYLLISTAILFLWTALFFSNICNAQTFSKKELEKAASKPYEEIEVKNDIIIEIIGPQVGDYTSDLKQEVINQRIRVKEGQNPLRAYYFAILKLNARFKERYTEKAEDFYIYGGGNFVDEDRVESIYLLENRVVHINFPFVDVIDTLPHIKVYDPKIVEKYFSPRKDTKLYDDYGQIYYIPSTKLKFGFVNELGAYIAVCKIGKQAGLDYKSYKNRAEIRLEYLKEVYIYSKQKKVKNTECIGQLLILFEKELARL